MDTEETNLLLAATPAMAYREYLYRPGSPLARVSTTTSSSLPGLVNRSGAVCVKATCSWRWPWAGPARGVASVSQHVT